MIELGANTDAINKYGQNALHYLCSTETKCTKEEKYINVVIKKLMTFQNVNQKDEDGLIPLFGAIITGKTKAVEAHLKYNTDFNVKVLKYGPDFKVLDVLTPYKLAYSKLLDNTTNNQNNIVVISPKPDDPAFLIFKIIATNSDEKPIGFNPLEPFLVEQYNIPDLIPLGLHNDDI